MSFLNERPLHCAAQRPFSWIEHNMTLEMHLSAWVYGEAELRTALPSLRMILHKTDEPHHTTSTKARKRTRLKLLKPHQKLEVSFSCSYHIGLKSNKFLGDQNRKAWEGRKHLQSMLFHFLSCWIALPRKLRAVSWKRW